MFNPLGFISKFIKSGNQKELDRIAKIVENINSLEENFKILMTQIFQTKRMS
jgi:preprotein translocase subunit SecA